MLHSLISKVYLVPSFIKKILKKIVTHFMLTFKKVIFSQRLEKIPDGEHKVKSDRELKFHPQRATNAFPWHKFGWEDNKDYQFWSERICAIACLKMVLDFFGSGKPVNLANLTKEALKAGGYFVHDKSGKLIDKGWFHHALVQVAKNFGLRGKSLTYASVEQILWEISQNHLIIASVEAQTIRQKNSPPKELATRIDHLVIVSGFQRKNRRTISLSVYNPSDPPIRNDVATLIPYRIFTAAYNHRFMSFWKE